MSLFQQLNNQGITIVLVTHEPDIALYSKRIVEVKDGLIIRDAQIKNRKNAEEDLKVLNSTAADSVVEIVEQTNLHKKNL
jgi:putative ABC transport system ATP-binding protein